ncbi:MAG TPA: ATP-binding protein, partial [Chthoniobacterales bacterium]|nr:ATP-binding protein [Chthoniobacterales bacterium]
MMDVGAFLRRLTAYILLAAYLISLYALVWWAAGHVVRAYLGWSESAAHILAALILVLSMAPAQGVFQNFAGKLFAGGALDFRATVSKAASILSSVTTLQDLLQRFAKTIAEAARTDRVIILLPEKHGFAEAQGRGAEPTANASIFLTTDDPVIQYLQTYRSPIVLDELVRVRATPESAALIKRMAELQLALVMGIFARDHLRGAMLLGPRPSGRIYDSVEQNALQVLCGQLAVAIDNAQLFTEVENARIYNETLLENLTTGVIAAGADERVTVFNNEAGQVTGLNPRDIIDHSLDRLPKGLREILCETLRTRDRQENSELVLPLGDHTAVVRASSSIFHGQQGEMLGALVVLTDITALKRLELQIRRSDRLASLGTLSAGMAHEIKNPLVSIKTFAQLLPERYQDSDFRDTFSNLIGHEIDRIDSLVNQLLRFARPAKPVLAPMHVHDVLEKSLQLVGHRLYQKEIKLTRSWEADVDTIRADADQLEQVFLNFFLNAMDAMKRGGELHVTTEIHAATEWVTAISGTNGDSHEILRVSIRDDGEGIRKEDVAHVFDPFFTTKDYGTGLGLSVVHGIIQEHGGQIEVESELKKGTAFHILLPLVRFAQGVAAA